MSQSSLGLTKDSLHIELFCVKTLEKNIGAWLNNGAEFILCDGNHRSVAYTLQKRLIPTWEIKNFSDLQFINDELTKQGIKGPYKMRESASIEDYFFRLYRAIAPWGLYTIKGKVDSLMNSKELTLENSFIHYNPCELPF